MPFERSLLPDPVDYFENQGLTLKGPLSAKWKTTECRFHGGSDSMRINVASGGWCCMSCGEKGGDTLAYEMAATGADFVTAAKALGVWMDDGRQYSPQKPTPLSPRAALAAMDFECTLVAIAAANLSQGVLLTDTDRARLLTSANRIYRIVEIFTCR